MFKLSPTPLGSLDLKNEFVNPQAGAFACFEGWVRDHNEGKKVKSLSYEAYEALCLAEAEKIFGQAKKQFSIFEAKCYHRVGYLKIGEMAVWVGVTAAHREDAFKACRYLIDEVKARLPIWKKEYYANGDSGWVGCEHCGLHPSDHPHHETQVSRINESAFYSRQTILPEIGAEGQAKLKQAKVLVVGAGGLGSACLTALAQVGIGTIGICEFDRLEASNLHRQSLYSHEDVGKPKIDLAVNRIKSINPFIIVKTHPEKLNVENIEAIIRDYDLLVDGTDNFVTKFLLNDASVIFKKPLVQASIYQFEGQLRVYDPASPSACLRCLWPKMPPPGCVDNCAQAGVLGIVPNVLGNLEAFEAIKYFLKLPGSLTQEHLIFDFTSYSLLKLKSGPSLNCPLCGNNPAIRAIESKNYSFEENDSGLSIYLPDLVKTDLSKYIFIDVRELVECLTNPVEAIECLHLPSSQWKDLKFHFENDYQYLIFCEKGLRSLNLVKELRERGIFNVHSIVHGVSAVKEFDPAFLRNVR